MDINTDMECIWIEMFLFSDFGKYVNIHLKINLERFHSKIVFTVGLTFGIVETEIENHKVNIENQLPQSEHLFYSCLT